METQNTMNSQSNLEKEKWSQRNKALYFRQYYKATLIKTVWYWPKDRNTSQWSKIENSKINPALMGTLSTTKEAKIYTGEKTVSSTSGAGKTGQLHVKE